jgi:hypothetical protein
MKIIKSESSNNGISRDIPAFTLLSSAKSKNKSAIINDNQLSIAKSMVRRNSAFSEINFYFFFTLAK